MNEAKQRGLLIVFEGLDRCGKSTQCQNLLQNLQNSNKSAEIIRFPERTTVLGKMIDQYLKGQKALNDQTIHLLFSANRWEKSQEIQEKINQGTYIILDRYAYSGVSFTAAKGLDQNWCKSCDIGLPEPDIVFFLKASEKVAESRGGFGDEIYEKTEFQNKVKEQFLDLQKQEKWIEINADQSIQEIQNQIFDIVSKSQNEKGNQPLGKLWINNEDNAN